MDLDIFRTNSTIQRRSGNGYEYRLDIDHNHIW